MNARSVTATFRAPREEVFAYLADIERLPEWATEFARELKVVDGRHKVVNGPRRVLLRDPGRPRHGRDRHARWADRGRARALPDARRRLPGGGSAFTFTMFQGTGMPDQLFESQYASLRELEGLVQRFG